MAKCKPGDRIKLISMDDFDPIPPGTLGTVTYINENFLGQTNIYIDWDIDRSLAVIEDVDEYEVITKVESIACEKCGGEAEFIELRDNDNHKPLCYDCVLFNHPLNYSINTYVDGKPAVTKTELIKEHTICLVCNEPIINSVITDSYVINTNGGASKLGHATSEHLHLHDVLITNKEHKDLLDDPNGPTLSVNYKTNL